MLTNSLKEMIHKLNGMKNEINSFLNSISCFFKRSNNLNHCKGENKSKKDFTKHVKEDLVSPTNFGKEKKAELMKLLKSLTLKCKDSKGTRV